MKKFLVVVDMQKDVVDGALGSKEAVAIVPNVKKKISEYVANGDKIVYTRDTHGENYLETNEGKHLPVKHCIKDTDGWQIYDGLYVDGCSIVDKGAFGFPFWNQIPATSVDLPNSEEIEIIGLCTDICVVSNALILKAQFPEHKITVDSSCCAGVTPESHEAALTTMKMCQIEVI